MSRSIDAFAQIAVNSPRGAASAFFCSVPRVPVLIHIGSGAWVLGSLD